MNASKILTFVGLTPGPAWKAYPRFGSDRGGGFQRRECLLIWI